jgi:tetratricopeptide (TPR) repeat protein
VSTPSSNTDSTGASPTSCTTPDHLTAARATTNLGVIANLRGRHQAALAQYRLAIPAYQRLGFPRGLGETHHNLAITLRDLGQLDEADRQERRAIAFAEEAGHRQVGAMARAGRAELGLRRGEPEVAAAGARLAAREYLRLGEPVGEADALRLLGMAATVLGSLAEARSAIDRGLKLADRYGSLLLKAEALRARAGVLLQAGETHHAARAVADARALLDELGATAEREALDRWWSSVR